MNAKWTLVVGNKNLSSWSLRPWLALSRVGVPFEEIVVPLDQPDTKARLLECSPSGRVPALVHGDLTIWDSLAICEYLAEEFPEAKLWPEDKRKRALARAVSAEMHSGFAALRRELPMNLCARITRARSAEVEADVSRILASWEACRKESAAEGPFLFGAFSIADCMYAPVVGRFFTYDVPVASFAKEYMDAVWSLPSMQTWLAAARLETQASPA